LTDGTYSITDKQKANTFAKLLHEICIPHQDNVDNNNCNDIQYFLKNPLPVFLPAKPTTPREIEYTIKKLPVGKSPGYDLITNKILKHLTKTCILFRTYIYNRMPTLSFFPS